METPLVSDWLWFETNPQLERILNKGLRDKELVLELLQSGVQLDEEARAYLASLIRKRRRLAVTLHPAVVHMTPLKPSKKATVGWKRHGSVCSREYVHVEVNGAVKTEVFVDLCIVDGAS